MNFEHFEEEKKEQEPHQYPGEDRPSYTQDVDLAEFLAQEALRMAKEAREAANKLARVKASLSYSASIRNAYVAASIKNL